MVDVKLLADFLKSAFNHDELRRFVAGLPGGQELVDSVAFSAPMATLAYELAEAIGRRGGADGSLVAALLDERPNRADEVRAMFGSLPSPRPATTGSTAAGISVHNHGTVTNQVFVGTVRGDLKVG